ncbi:acetate--CoA ligase [Thermus scotoductus]|uniref:Acetyl-coenzyme A synthetase n=1 Tax=Thermus scotoductus TaxID=37636 RepID=A0A430RCI7_THESC|nr:acetate--CoA ligase [Thermus scotoductus]RTG97837.1 acetate--CoA ligase [Thermus scotoductus]RTH05112.1 acetate--CoA ligase [Thermus scotoductus]RTH15969.1 acetate--CoA ligase [Thermus scotoductus]RTI02204.1 acetate--CoA ligase [Thermus scotoductus]RTI23840.1 acetate--CoA ligase [Thermus scotoductus]
MDRIEGVLKEERVFYPSEEFRSKAHIKSEEEYQRLYEESLKDPEGFWGRVASELHWFEPWQKVLEGDLPHAKWFVGGKTNLSYNALDRHVKTWRRNKAALVWEGEPGEERVLTYHDLWREVQKFANVLKRLGVKKGDRVTIYLPMIPEAAIAMLACTRIGAIHSVVFGGFSSGALAERIRDAEAKVLITADGGYRRGQVVPLKQNADEALKEVSTVEHVVVVRRTGEEVPWTPGRDHWWHELMEAVSDRAEAEPMEAEEPLFILYTSGSTGKPKGVLHTLGGYMTYVYLTTKLVFDLKDEDVYWCTADVGWITGHSYVVYGPLLNGATTVMYEGAPNWPEPDRFWQIVDKYGVNILYTAPTAIRAFMKWGEGWPLKHRLDSLRLLGTVGEPINPEAWLWYYQVIGKGRCPIVDTWWQTETGGIMITTLPGVHPMKPGHAGKPFFGVRPEILDSEHRPVENPDEGGHLCITRPWPSMLRTVWGDPDRFLQQYFSQHPGSYFTGDGARRDKDGYYLILGRVDDVLNVAGHRLGTMEIESALVSHPAVAEAAVVGRPDPLKGEAIVAFVTLKEGHAPSEALRDELKAHVAKVIGPIARPDEVRFTEALPKTRSGKIMRRLLRQIAAGEKEIKGDTSTLEDHRVVERLKEGA